MAIGLMISIPGATEISHLAGSSADGWCVVDTWESRADFDRFMAGRLGEHLQRVGTAQPQITEFDVYREDRR